MSILTECNCGYCPYACNGYGEGHCKNNPDNFKLIPMKTQKSEDPKKSETYSVKVDCSNCDGNPYWIEIPVGVPVNVKNKKCKHCGCLTIRRA